MLLHTWTPDLVKTLAAASAAAGKPVLPAGTRDNLLLTVLTVPLGTASMAEYASLLAEVLGREAAPADAEGLSVERLYRDGPAALSDDELVRLAFSPSTLRRLCERINDTSSGTQFGRCWDEGYDDIASRLPPEYLHGEGSQRMIDEIIAIERGPE